MLNGVLHDLQRLTLSLSTETPLLPAAAGMQETPRPHSKEAAAMQQRQPGAWPVLATYGSQTSV